MKIKDIKKMLDKYYDDEEEVIVSIVSFNMFYRRGIVETKEQWNFIVEEWKKLDTLDYFEFDILATKVMDNIDRFLKKYNKEK